MTVRELVTTLTALPMDHEVVVAIDEEGNGYRPVREAAVSSGIDDPPYGWEAVHPDDIGTEYDGADITERVVIWP